MKKPLLLLLLSLGFIGNSYSAILVLTCDTESVEVGKYGKRTTFPNSTSTITMILEHNNKKPVAEITSITTKKIIGGAWSDGKKMSVSTKYKILKQNDDALTAIDEKISPYGAEILFLNKKNGIFSSANSGMGEVVGTSGNCYK